jgi:hypothetical protein
VLDVAAPPAAPAPDTTAPDTTGLSGKKKVVKGKKVTFRFAATEPGSTFRCAVDDKAATPCTSPHKVATKKLKAGKHTFRVYAVDAAGNADKSVAQRKFRVVPRPAP